MHCYWFWTITNSYMKTAPRKSFSNALLLATLLFSYPSVFHTCKPWPPPPLCDVATYRIIIQIINALLHQTVKTLFITVLFFNICFKISYLCLFCFDKQVVIIIDFLLLLCSQIEVGWSINHLPIICTNNISSVFCNSSVTQLHLEGADCTNISSIRASCYPFPGCLSFIYCSNVHISWHCTTFHIKPEKKGFSLLKSNSFS